MARARDNSTPRKRRVDAPPVLDKIDAAVDQIGKALVLADYNDPGSLADIVAATLRLEELVGPRRDDPTLAAFLSAARALEDLPASDARSGLEALGARFESLRVLARASTPSTEPGGATPSAPVPDADSNATAKSGAQVMPLAGDEELLRDFVARAEEHLEAADEHLLVLEKEPGDRETLDAVFRVFHTIKGMAGFLGLTEIEALAHGAEDLLDSPRRGHSTLDRTGFDTVFGSIDTMKALVSAVASPSASVADPARTPTEAASHSGSGAHGAVASTRPTAPAATDTTNSVRVDEERLDRLLDTIGELVIAESMFSESARTRTGAFSPLAAQLSRLDKITRELQGMATSLRMVPLKSTFIRLARLVRDVSGKAGKKVDLIVVGEDTELDKLVVDRIYDPLVHIMRNAVDHGIEQPDERRALGKPEAGRIELRAYHADGSIHIEVRDDGRGVDLDAVASRAKEQGLLGGDEVVSERDAVALLFEPGLSTARTITDVSGRGVGMDVVRKVVDSLRGQIDVQSDRGAGTLISIRLPLTLAIIDGMVVRVGSERYIIPTLSIERSLRPTRAQISGVLGTGAVLELGDALLPLVGLGTLFGSEGAEQDPTEAIVVVVGTNGDRVGLVACEILGQQQIVIKSLGEFMQGITGIAGGAILPDGKVGLIVDVSGLIQLART